MSISTKIAAFKGAAKSNKKQILAVTALGTVASLWAVGDTSAMELLNAIMTFIQTISTDVPLG